jgi:hypothetical protein
MKHFKTLPQEWQDYESFREAVGEPPDAAARLARHKKTKPHSRENTYWIMPKKDYLTQELRRKLKEEYILHNKDLMKIRSAKTKDARIQNMITARNEGYTYEMIGIAAGLTNQRVQVIIAKHLEQHKTHNAH